MSDPRHRRDVRSDQQRPPALGEHCLECAAHARAQVTFALGCQSNAEAIAAGVKERIARIRRTPKLDGADVSRDRALQRALHKCAVQRSRPFRAESRNQARLHRAG